MRKLLNAVGGWLADRFFPHRDMTIGMHMPKFTCSSDCDPSRIARVIKGAIAEKSRYPKA